MQLVYTLNWAFRRGWGFGPEATPARYLQAEFSFQLAFGGLEDRGLNRFVSWNPDRFELRMDRHLVYTFCRAMPQTSEFHHGQEATFPGNEEAEAKKRKLEEPGSEGSEPRK